MTYLSSPAHPLQGSSSFTEQNRQRLAAAVISFTKGTSSVFSNPREQQLLAQFMRGRITLDEVVYYLEAIAQPAN